MGQEGRLIDELELMVERGKTAEAIEITKDAVAFSGTVLGKKISKRLLADLESIRRKYISIPFDAPAVLAKTQGREQELGELVAIFCDGRHTLELLNKKLEALSVSIERVKTSNLSMGR